MAMEISTKIAEQKAEEALFCSFNPSPIRVGVEFIRIKIHENIFRLTPQEAERLINQIRDKLTDTDYYKSQMKEVESCLAEFEASNRQFPDELFKPKD